MDLFYRSGDILMVKDPEKQRELFQVSSRKELSLIYFVVTVIELNFKYNGAPPSELSLLGCSGHIEYFYGRDVEEFNLIKIGHIKITDPVYIIHGMRLDQAKSTFNRCFEQASRNEFVKIIRKI